MSSKFHGYSKNDIMYHVQSQSLSKMCTYRGDGCSSMHMDYLFLIENGNFFSSQHCTYFVLPSEFGVSIHNERNRPVLVNSYLFPIFF